MSPPAAAGGAAGPPSGGRLALTYVVVLGSLVAAARVVPSWAFACAGVLSLCVLIVVGVLHLRATDRLGDATLERIVRAMIEALARRR